MDSELGSGSGVAGAPLPPLEDLESAQLPEGERERSDDEGMVIGIVVGAVLFVAVVSIAAAVFVSVRAIRQRKKELELQSGGDVETPPPTLGGQMTSIKAQLDEQRAWCRKRYGKDWTATDYSARLAEARAALRPKTDAPVRAAGAVSYTHLTLPTILLV